MISIVGLASLKWEGNAVEGDVNAVIFACSREGKQRKKAAESGLVKFVHRHKPICKTNCKTRMQIKTYGDEDDNIVKYEVIEMVKRLSMHLKFERYILPRCRNDFKRIHSSSTCGTLDHPNRAMDLFDSLYNLGICTEQEVMKMVNSSKDNSEYAAVLFKELKGMMATHMSSNYLRPSSIGSTPTEVDKIQPPEVVQSKSHPRL
ncbi:hypothetical protein QJS10_CPA06g01213 [Acorus calamus]|uniref:Uncharacterized protein n=1 Tax=Acorus calamus TaxID=4465 RepID=A0AAV9EKM0_ACOCL|nr:hypothetical protein QJS10_CPA06g01213 [Acorus calamus]